MTEEPEVYAGCECGERYPVPIGGADLETLQFTCPKCGKTEGFTTDQVLALKAHFGDAVAQLSDELASRAAKAPL